MAFKAAATGPETSRRAHGTVTCDASHPSPALGQLRGSLADRGAAVEVTDRPAVEEDEERGGLGTLGSAMRLLFVAWGGVIASFPLNDNSFFTHLATGRIILEDGSVPSTDPYTFTAQGANWTVQSWLASVAYASAERLGGAVGLRILMLTIFTAMVLLIWRLSRPADSIFLRLLIVFGALVVGTGLWSERPYMVGVIGLGVVWLALEGTVQAWLLVPLLWVWANSHGSFPLAGVLVVAVVAGELLDRRRSRDGGAQPRLGVALRTEWTVFKATVAGTLLAVIGPLGFDVLLFPLKAVTQSQSLSAIVEWQPPAFRSGAERMFLVLVLVAIIALVRDGRFRLAVPTAVVVGSAIVAQRNVVMATVVLVPVLAACAPSMGTLTARTRPRLGPAFTAVCGLAAALACVLALAGPSWALGGYPTGPLAWLQQGGVPRADVRLATEDLTGNLLELLDGPQGVVFIDDRADMYPESIFDDYVDLVRGRPTWSQILNTYEIDVVLWDRSRPMGSLLATDPGWQTVFSDTTWTVACRRGADACETLKP